MNDQDKIHILSRAVIIDKNNILLCKTVDLDKNFYFLPGGHIEHGESVENSLLRELQEETGFECHIKKYLGCLEYSFEPDHSNICHNHEYSFIFEVDSVHLKSDRKVLCPEKQIELLWLPISDLSEIDFRAQPLKKLLDQWLSGDSGHIFMSDMI